jgi:hypothetical protein
MTKFLLTNPTGGPLDYPALGFSAVNGAILNGANSTPAITSAPDARWAVYGGGSAETGISRYAPPATTPVYTEPTNGYILTYSDTDNAGTWQDVTTALTGVHREQANGVAGLDASGLLYDARLPTTAVRFSDNTAFADISKYSGVDPTGVTECAAAINTALTTIAAAGARAYAKGTFKIASTVTILGSCDFGDATFNWTGANTGLAVQIGVGTSGTLLQYKQIVCPSVINTMKVTTGWAGSSVGIKATNTQRCSIDVPRVKGFVTGYYAYGLGAGNSYNQVSIAHAETNKRNLVLGAGTGGWSNSNTYILGSMFHDSSEGTNVSGVRQLLLETATSTVNGNLFIGGSVEGDTAEFHIDCDGTNNRFLEIRYEVTGGARVKWQANAAQNTIDGGYAASSIVETHVANPGVNRMLTTGGPSHLLGIGTKGVAVYENQSSSAYPSVVIMAAGAHQAGANPATAYGAFLGSQISGFKDPADAFDRLQIDALLGRLLLGFGTATPTISWGICFNTPEGAVTAPVGSVRLRSNGGAGTTLYVKETGSGNTGWRAV